MADPSTIKTVEVVGADRVGRRYVLTEEREDGSLVISPDTSIEAIRSRLGTRAATPEEFDETFGKLPADAEG